MALVLNSGGEYLQDPSQFQNPVNEILFKTYFAPMDHLICKSLNCVLIPLLGTRLAFSLGCQLAIHEIFRQELDITSVSQTSVLFVFHGLASIKVLRSELGDKLPAIAASVDDVFFSIQVFGVCMAEKIDNPECANVLQVLRPDDISDGSGVVPYFSITDAHQVYTSQYLFMALGESPTIVDEAIRGYHYIRTMTIYLRDGLAKSIQMHQSKLFSQVGE